MRKHTITPEQVYGTHSLILASASSTVNGSKKLELVSVITISGIDSYYKITVRDIDRTAGFTTDLRTAIKEYNKY